MLSDVHVVWVEREEAAGRLVILPIAKYISTLRITLVHRVHKRIRAA